MKKGKKKTCPGCGGSGQVSFFQGESRFLLTMEECPECFGTGTLLIEGSDPTKKKKRTAGKNKKEFDYH
jgi:DnaJ-class molecular chaperone